MKSRNPTRGTQEGDLSTRDLLPPEIERFRATASHTPPSTTTFAGVDALGAANAFLLTGIHPICLEIPTRSRFYHEEVDGVQYVSFHRPKKKGVWSKTVVPIHVDDLPQLPSVLTFLGWAKANPRSTEFYRQLFISIGKRAGIEGDVTSRTLRHTFLSTLARRGANIEELMRIGNVSAAVASQYLRSTPRYTDRDFVTRGSVRGSS